MKFVAIAVTVVLSFGALVNAGEFPVQTPLGQQVITEIPPPPPPATKPKLVPGGDLKPGEAKPAKLNAKDWVCGRCFTDGSGRRWCLASGSPHSKKPAVLPGWLMRDKSGRLSFMTTNGSLYRPYPGVGVPVPRVPAPPASAQRLKAVIRDVFDHGQK